MDVNLVDMSAISSTGTNSSNQCVQATPATCDPVDQTPKSTVKTSKSIDVWVVLISSFLYNILFGLEWTGFSVMFAALTAHFTTTRASIAWISSIDNCLSYLLAIFCSYPVQVYGCRLPALVGSALYTAGITACFLAPSLPYLYIMRGVLCGVGSAIATLARTVVLQQRVSNRHRALATGLTLLGVSVGTFCGPPITDFFIRTYGWRGAMLLLGGLQAHRLPLSITFSSPKGLGKIDVDSSEVKRHQNVCVRLVNYMKSSLDFSLLRRPSYLLFCIAVMLRFFVATSYLAHIVSRSMQAGVERTMAAWAVSTSSICIVVVRLFVSLTSDLSYAPPRLLVFAGGLSFMLMSVITLYILPPIVATFASLVLNGMHAGCTNTLITVIIVDLLGVSVIDRSQALCYFLIALPVLIASPLIGAIYDVFGNYDAAYALLGVVSFIASLLSIGAFALINTP